MKRCSGVRPARLPLFSLRFQRRAEAERPSESLAFERKIKGRSLQEGFTLTEQLSSHKFDGDLCCVMMSTSERCPLNLDPTRWLHLQLPS